MENCAHKIIHIIMRRLCVYLLILYIDLHVARMYTKFGRNCPQYQKDRAGLVQNIPARLPYH
jgi:hypothetical protein